MHGPVRLFLPSRLAALMALLLFHCAATAAGDATARVSAAQFREDIAFVRAMIARMHPDPAFSTDPQAMHRALDRLAQEVPPTLTRDEAWRRLATLNPLLADGHFMIGYPDWRGETAAWLAGGGSLFPVEVSLDADGKLTVDGEAETASPARIVSVNGVEAEVLVSALSSRVHGDTRRFRAALLGQRWWLFYWKTYGAPASYELVLEEEGVRRTVSMPGRRSLPRILQGAERAPYALALRADGSAVLTANVMRDFGFATLVGIGGAARQAQSGGVRDAMLPHTGLVVSLPRFILDPPAGPAPGAFLEPGPTATDL